MIITYVASVLVTSTPGCEPGSTEEIRIDNQLVSIARKLITELSHTFEYCWHISWSHLWDSLSQKLGSQQGWVGGMVDFLHLKPGKTKPCNASHQRQGNTSAYHQHKTNYNSPQLRHDTNTSTCIYINLKKYTHTPHTHTHKHTNTDTHTHTHTPQSNTCMLILWYYIKSGAFETTCTYTCTCAKHVLHILYSTCTPCKCIFPHKRQWYRHYFPLCGKVHSHVL